MVFNPAMHSLRIYPIQGLTWYVAQAGIKKEKLNDLSVMVLDSGTVGAVFTKNQFCAAPVKVCKYHLSIAPSIKALVINTGNANAGTGEKGWNDALLVCQSLATKLACQTEQILPFSTGVIMQPLPVDKIITGLNKLQPAHWEEVASAIMTTDTVPKLYSCSFTIQGKKVHITGVAKGSGMIHPNMATLLSFVATDASIHPKVLNQLLRETVEDSFNSISVDGDTSTNDSFVLVATGKSNLVLKDTSSTEYVLFRQALQQALIYLAKAIVKDGEGATKLISICVCQAESRAEAKKVGYRIATSPLVKTAFFASDANLGRILCAIGNSEIENFNPNQLRLFLNETLVFEQGAVSSTYTEALGQKILAQEEIQIQLELGRGIAAATIYTCDLSYDYIRINAAYRT
ncbi:MAG: bifunctional glutamate N-acetyltransferase/amino-acid acetyltransferase ArgJ [Neisseriaceae bacterium]